MYETYFIPLLLFAVNVRTITKNDKE